MRTNRTRQSGGAQVEYVLGVALIVLLIAAGVKELTSKVTQRAEEAESTTTIVNDPTESTIYMLPCTPGDPLRFSGEDCY